MVWVAAQSQSRKGAWRTFWRGWRCLTRGCHLVWAFKSASPLRDGSCIPARGWKPGTCSCSWIWSLRRWISRRCISMILPVSSCTFNLMVGGTLGKSSLDTAGDRAGLGLGGLSPDCCKGFQKQLILPSPTSPGRPGSSPLVARFTAQRGTGNHLGHSSPSRVRTETPSHPRSL